MVAEWTRQDDFAAGPAGPVSPVGARDTAHVLMTPALAGGAGGVVAPAGRD